MAAITIDFHDLVVRLTRAEKIFALRRHDIRVPLRAIHSTTVEADAVAAAQGIRAPGLAIPKLVKVGTWRRRGHRTFVSVRRGTPALHLQLDDGTFDALLISTPRAEAVAGRIAPAPSSASR